MQSHNDDQRPTQGNPDGGRDAERDAVLHEIGVAFAKVFNPNNGTVHLAAAGQPVNMGASLHGSGKVNG